MKHKVVNASYHGLGDVIKKYEKLGYEVCGLTWVETELEYVIVFKCSESNFARVQPEVKEDTKEDNKEKKDKDETLEETILRLIKEYDNKNKINTNKDLENYKYPWNTDNWKINPYIWNPSTTPYPMQVWCQTVSDSYKNTDKLTNQNTAKNFNKYGKFCCTVAY